MQQSPLEHYQQLIDSGDFSRDANQFQAVSALDNIWRELTRPRKAGLLDRIRGREPAPVRGLYLWGSVGRGKTWLMDLFYERLPEGSGKQRVHFHRFMQRIHGELNSLGEVQNPLPVIASKWAEQGKILCLDEFFVSDIADAMLLAGLLEALFEEGVTLVTTSNSHPDSLYRNGLQRAKFLPAIEQIKQHTHVMKLAGDTDFRLRILEQSEIFLHPLGKETDEKLTACFNRMAAESELNHDLDINGRNFHAHRRGDGIIWFDFEELCIKPRGAVDYIEIARAFNTVVLGNMPQLAKTDDNAARRFITLVDEFYDRNVKLLMSADAPVRQLYTGELLKFEFERTASRLTEMQSLDYLARPHLP